MMRAITGIALTTMLFTPFVQAADVQIEGTVTKTVQLSNHVMPMASVGEQPNQLKTAKPTKQIALLRLNLSNQAKSSMKDRLQATLVEENSTGELSVSQSKQFQIDLGMNDVPVLDQGMHGTCATFANTAAVDAAMGRGKYISQVCQLQLGTYLEQQSYMPSGWDGSLGPVVLNQMTTFGIVSQQTEKQIGCNGAFTYPTVEPSPKTGISISAYHRISEELDDEQISWSSLLDVHEFSSQEHDPNTVLSKVKTSLEHGHRVTFGVLLINTSNGVAGATGRSKTFNDTWLLSEKDKQDLISGEAFDDAGGHEMIIIGFDDAATALDQDGKPHHGLLKLRNSWGEDVGNLGDFYMTYDYFKVLAIEAQKIRSSS